MLAATLRTGQVLLAVFHMHNGLDDLPVLQLEVLVLVSVQIVLSVCI